VKVYAPAKLNLYLEVVSKRPDGYHELRTLMTLINLCDEIELEPLASGIELEESGSGCEAEQNLVYRAARLFFETTASTRGVRIRLAKRIPVGAGLGGGSSDAAHVLTAMNTLFHAGLSQAALADMAGRLGADCPFFVYGRTAFMGDRGDRVLQDVQLEERCYLLAVPPIAVSTAQVYGNLKISLTEARERSTIDTIVEKRVAPENVLMNALEAVAFKLYPELAALKEDLLASGALGALMSGSGSAVFGVYQDQNHLQRGMESLTRHEGYRYIPTTRMTGGLHGDYRS